MKRFARWLAFLSALSASAAAIEYRVDPITRYVYVEYNVPAGAPSEITVQVEHRPCETKDWRPAAVWPHVSDTAEALIPDDEWNTAIVQGRFTENLAAGLRRTLVWNPLDYATRRGCAMLRITLRDRERVIGVQEAAVNLDNSDVVLIRDWKQVVQSNRVSETPGDGQAVWWLAGGLRVKQKGVPLPQLTVPLNLRGPYAVFVSMPAVLSGVELRLTGDDYCDYFESLGRRRERFWRWTDLSRQHLVIRQPYRTIRDYEDHYRAALDAVRMVPLTPALVGQLEAKWGRGKERRLVGGYTEPYSWSFYESVEANAQHWETVKPFADAGVDLLDIQVTRGGSKAAHESRVDEQLLGETYGDPERGAVPTTGNVGRMVQYTNPLGAELRFARLLGMLPFANVGATRCYAGTLLEGEISRKHPEWRIKDQLNYEIPEVRQHVVRVVEEFIEIGAKAVSIDWCRYPYALRDAKTATVFQRELRAMARRHGAIHIMVRFPVRGSRGGEFMDYRAWAREGLVDTLVPSTVAGEYPAFDAREYLNTARGTKARVIPCADAAGFGLAKPGMLVERVLNLYEQGAPGVYIYGCEIRTPESRRNLRLIGSVDGLRAWRQRERAEQSRYSKGVYLNHSGASILNPVYQGMSYRADIRPRVWVEGFVPDKVELYLDGRLARTHTRPPYILAPEDAPDGKEMKRGRHELLVKAWTGGESIERRFTFNFRK